MTENLILFTITPVQKFITTARKTEDMWLGSYILSHLNATAIHEIYAREGIRIIYPSIGDDSPFDFWQGSDITLPTFPNLFLAMSEKSSIEELHGTMQEVENVVQREFEAMAKHAVDVFTKAVGNSSWEGTYAEQLFERQVKHFLELYWVVSSGSSDTYQEWYAQTGTRLASAKNCRAFHQITESGRACSLCGEREIFHNDNGNPMEWWARFANRRESSCSHGEALCTVCLTKRLARSYFRKKYPEVRELSFPSTSEVSTADFKFQIATDEKYSEFVKSVEALQLVKALQEKNSSQLAVRVTAVPKVAKIQEVPNADNVDGEWLFEESPASGHLDSDRGMSGSDEYKAYDRLRRDLIRSVGSEPSRYFAVIALDGDGMGQTIAQAADWETHTDISKKLNGYTVDVRRIVEDKYLGKLIYAGGDDVLALANLADLLNILRELRDKFPNLNSDEESVSTASAGVCIAHCKVPLGDVLARARIMERAAKSVKKKNALGISLLKHSGNISETVFKWEYGAEDADALHTIPVLQDLIGIIKRGEVSKKFMYTFRDTFSRLQPAKGTLVMPDIVMSELGRLIWRATSEDARSDAEIKRKIDETVEKLRVLLTQKDVEFENFISLLEITNFIAREQKTDATLSQTE